MSRSRGGSLRNLSQFRDSQKPIQQIFEAFAALSTPPSFTPYTPATWCKRSTSPTTRYVQLLVSDHAYMKPHEHEHEHGACSCECCCSAHMRPPLAPQPADASYMDTSCLRPGESAVSSVTPLPMPVLILAHKRLAARGITDSAARCTSCARTRPSAS